MSEYPSKLHRVVTGHNDRGEAIVASDTEIDGEAMLVSAGIKGAAIWVTESIPTNDNNNTEDGAKRVIDNSPNEGLVQPKGTNFRFTDLPPDWVSPMHRTSSLDYNIVFGGEVVHITEDGTEKHLGSGDVLIQKGTLHAWKNPSSTAWVRLYTVLISAEPAVVNGKELEPIFIPANATKYS